MKSAVLGQVENRPNPLYPLKLALMRERALARGQFQPGTARANVDMRSRSSPGNGRAKGQVRNVEFFEQLPQPKSFRCFRIQSYINAVAMIETHRLMHKRLSQRADRQGLAKALLK